MKRATHHASRHPCVTLAGVVLWTLLTACSSEFETPELQGGAALVKDAGTPRLWVLTKQEESRQVRVGGGRHSTGRSRRNTYFHFDLQAYDPVRATPLWRQRLLTIGNSNASGSMNSWVIGSDVGARMLGQDGDIVWLLIGEKPYALRASDGSILVQAETLQEINPSLRGVLPSESKFYGFDRGLVIMTADAQRFVIRGEEHKAAPYTAPPPPAEPEGPLLANGARELVPTMPYGEVPARHVTLDGKRLFLYTEKEAADAASDEWGQHLRWPYTVVNEGKLARRTFRNATIETTQRFDERYERIAGLTPVADAPTFLNGRFAKDPSTGNARVLEGPEGVLVWHSTRIDDAGHIALARLDASLTTVWHSELPLSESNFSRPISTWWLPTHLVMIGTQQVEENGGTLHVPFLVSVDLSNGSLQSARLTE